MKKQKKTYHEITARSQFGVILEDIQDKVSQVLEGHVALDKKIDTKIDGLRDEMNQKFAEVATGHGILSKKVDTLDKKVDTLDKKVDDFIIETRDNFKSVFEYLIRIDDEIQSIRSEMKELRKSLTAKVDYDRFERLEKRVAQVELVIQQHKLQPN